MVGMRRKESAGRERSASMIVRVVVTVEVMGDVSAE
jgi:hypothetical protein